MDSRYSACRTQVSFAYKCQVTISLFSIQSKDAKWSKSMGLSMDLSERGLGIRTARYAMIINDLKVEYIGVSVSHP